jgi:hypothetical protein
MRFRKGMIAAGVLAVISTAAISAGNWSTLPQVGMSSFCASTTSGFGLPTAQGPYGVVPGSTQGTSSSICGQTVPAGPSALTGSELVPADTQISNSSPPQTVSVPMPLFDAGVMYYLSGQTTPFSGATIYALPNNVNDILIDPTTTVSQLSLTMPTSPLNGQKLHITSSHTISALAVNGATGQTVVSGPTALTVSTTGAFGYTYIWYANTASWYRLQ